MRYRQIGRTDIRVSEIALGCWAFAGGAVWGEQNEDAAEQAVHAALDAGVNFFDTAELYGNGVSERILGRALQGRRDQAVIATKAASQHVSKQELPLACERSLKRLGTDYIDLYQVHWPNREVPIAETLDALEQLKRQGRIRAAGVSNFGPRDMTELLNAGRVESNQIPYSLLTRMVEHEVMPLCRAHEIGVLCYSPLAQGLLTGKWRTVEEVPEERRRNRLFACSRRATKHGEAGCEREVFEAVREIGAIARELGVPMSALALAWCLRQPGVTSALAGARSPAQVEQNTQAGKLALSDDVAARLAAATERVKEHLETNLDLLYSGAKTRYR